MGSKENVNGEVRSVKLPDGWKETTLGELGKIVTGRTPSTRKESNFGGSIPFVTPRDLDGSKTITKTERYLSEQGAQSVKNAILPQNTVMVSCIGSDMGKAAIAGRICVTNQQINSIIVNDDYSFQCVFYNLSTRKDEIRGRAGGSAQPILNKGHFGQLDITLPPLPEQKAIAHVLGSLDDKIELNRQMNATLEAMAQALFKSWFVDFDPVIDNALAAGNPIPDELQARAAARESLCDARNPLPDLSAEALAKAEHIQNLFPASFTHTEELGWIPEGWEVGPLSRVANLSTKAVSPFKQPDKVWTHYSIPAFDEGIQPTRDLGATIKSGKYKVHDDSVLASKLNPQFPRVWLVDANDEDSAICSTEFMPFRPKRAADRFYLYLFLRSDFAQQSIVDRVTGSTGSRQRVKPKEISQLKLVIPPENIREPFNQVISGPLYRVLLNRRATADLAKTRDTLLPKLLSGELRLPIEELEVAV